MRRTVKLITTVLPLLLTACVLTRGGGEDEAAAPKSPSDALLEAVQLVGGGVSVPPTRVASDLDSAEGTANASELYAIKRLRPLVERLMEPEPTLSPGDYGDAGKIINSLASEHPDDFEWQLTTTSALDFIGSSLQANPTQATSPESEGLGAPYALQRALTLVGRFPTQSRAHAHLAQVLQSSGGDQRSAMRSYVRCLQLDPNSSACMSGLKVMAAEYSKPHCKEFHASALDVHRGSKAAGKGAWQAVQVGKEKLFMETAAYLTGADLADANQSGASTTLTLSPSGAAHLEALTTELAASQAYLILKVGGKVDSAPRVLSPVTTGQLNVASTSFDLKKLCRVFDTKTLPEDVTGILR